MKIFSKIKKITNVLNFKIIKYIFIIILILLSSLSFFILLLLHWELLISRNNIFNFSLVGLDNYLSYLYKYSKIFGANIAVLSVYMIIHNSEENRKKDLYNDWLRKLDLLVSKIQQNDKSMADDFKLRSKVFFDVQYKHQFFISNKAELVKILHKMYKSKNEFTSKVNFYEDSNNRSMNDGNVYNSITSTFAFENFRYIFLSFFDNYYEGITKDLESIYLNELNPNSTIKK